MLKESYIKIKDNNYLNSKGGYVFVEIIDYKLDGNIKLATPSMSICT